MSKTTPPQTSHLALVQSEQSEARCCAACGSDRLPEEPSCATCGTEQPAAGWTRIMVKGATPIDDADEWQIEASLKAIGPVLRSRVQSHVEGAEAATVGVMSMVNDPGLFAAFERRGRSLTNARHHTILSPMCTGRHRGRPYRIDRRIQAPRLSTQLGQFTGDVVVDMVKDLAEGLAILHTNGVIHGNVCIDTVAIIHDVDGPQAVFVELPPIGVGPWIQGSAPEVMRGVPADSRTDVFGLGLVFWALVTGRNPREASRSSWADERPGPALSVKGELALKEPQKSLLRRMIDRDPRSRPQNMKEVIEGLHGLAPAPVVLDAPHASTRPSIPLPWIAGAAATVLLGVVGVGVGLSGVGTEAQTPIVTVTPAAAPLVAAPPPEVPAEPVVPTEPVAPTEPEPEPEVAPTEVVPAPAPAVPVAPPPTEPTGTASAEVGSAPAPRTSAPVPPPAERQGGSAEAPPATAPAPTPPRSPAPPPAGEASTPLDGRWSGIVHGRPTDITIVSRPDGTLSGTADIKVGTRVEQHPIRGRYEINNDGSATVSISLDTERAAWTGKMRGGQMSGDVYQYGRVRGTFELSH